MAGNQFQNRLKSCSLIGQNLFSGQSEGGNAKAGVQGGSPAPPMAPTTISP